MGQCTPALQEEVHGEPDYMSKSSTFDSVWLLQSLQKITAGVNKTTNKHHSAFKATKKFYGTQQSPTEGIDEFYNRFENAKDLVGQFNADVVDLTALLADEQKTNPTATKETTMQKFLAVAFIMGANGHAVTMENKYVIPRTGTRHLRETTIGWKLIVRWKDGSELHCLALG